MAEGLYRRMQDPHRLSLVEVVVVSTPKPEVADRRTDEPSSPAYSSSSKADSLTALLGAVLAGLGALVVLSVGIWLTETWPESTSWAMLCVPVFFLLVVVAVRRVEDWMALGPHSVRWGVVGLVLFLSGWVAFLILALIRSVADLPEWVFGEVALLCILLCFAGLMCALAAIPDRKRPGAGSGYTEQVLKRSIEAPGVLAPSEDEEAVLEHAIAHSYRFLRRSGGLLLGLPTVVRQADLVLPVDSETAGKRGREALAQADAVLVGDWVSGPQTVLRGWWQAGVRLNGCPVVVTLWLTPDTGGTTRTTVRAASKVFMLNKHIAENALSQIVTELQAGAPAPQLDR